MSPLLWLAAFILVAGFTYYSYQKTKAFENQVAEDAKNLGGQTNQFVFNPKAPREKKGTIKAKVLPLNAQNKEVDGLYNYLPDDLRPANLDEVHRRQDPAFTRTIITMLEESNELTRLGIGKRL